MDLNHRPLGYEPNRINDSSAFQRLDAAGNDTRSLKRHLSTVIGPQSDHTPACLLERVEHRLFRVCIASSFNNLQGLMGLPSTYNKQLQDTLSADWICGLEIVGVEAA